jgi:hypothetical protein
LFVSVTDNLIRPFVIQLVSVVKLQCAVDQRGQQNKGADEVDDFHQVAPVFDESNSLNLNPFLCPIPYKPDGTKAFR